MKIGVLGRIIGGKTDNWYITVTDDYVNTGGYLVLYSPNEDFSGEGYDNWFESLNEIEQHFRYNNYTIKWHI